MQSTLVPESRLLLGDSIQLSDPQGFYRPLPLATRNVRDAVV